MITNEILAYTAGIVDGDGCIHIGKHQPDKKNRHHSPIHYLLVNVSNTNKELIMWLQKTFGGSVNVKKFHGERRPCWRWIITTVQAAKFLECIYPFFIIKKRQAELAIEFQKMKTRPFREDGKRPVNTRLTQEMLQKRDWYKIEISKLAGGWRSMQSI